MRIATLHREFSCYFMTLRNVISAFTIVPVLALLAVSGYAQDFDVKWSEDRTSSKIPATGIIGRDASGLYIYRQNKVTDSSFQLDYYQFEDYQRVYTLDIPLPAIGKQSSQLEKIFLLNDHFVLFSSLYDKSNDQNRAFASLLNKQGEVVKAAVEVDRIDDVVNKKNTGNFGFQLSPDSTILLAFHNTPFRQNEKTDFSVKLFDTKLNSLWHKEFRMPYEKQDFEVVTALVDNRESIFMVCRLYGQGVFRASELGANKKYTLIHYNHRSRKLTEYEINVDNKWIHSARFQVVNDTTLVAAGFYSGSGQGNIAGSFYVSFNTETGDILHHGFEPLPRDVIIGVTYNDDLLFGGLASFELRKMLVREDGSAVLVAEKDYVTTTTYFDPYTGQRLISYYYHFDDVVLVSLSARGKTEWTRVLAKSQSSTNDVGNYTSIAVHEHQGTVSVLFNDHHQNLNMVRKPGDMRQLTNFSRSVAMIARYDRQGKVRTEPLFGAATFDAILRPRFSSEFSGNRQIIYGEQSGKDKFGEIFYGTP